MMMDSDTLTFRSRDAVNEKGEHLDSKKPMSEPCEFVFFKDTYRARFGGTDWEVHFEI